jgi:ATP-dependent Clp protease ATP-binding subunit ClpA
VEAPRAPFLLGETLDRGLAAVGTAWPACRPLLDHPALSGRLRWLELHEAGAGHTRAVLAAWRGRVAAHHGVDISEALLAPVLERSTELAGRLPGKALALLDAAAARAAVASAREVELVHLYLAVQSFPSR